MAKVQNRGRTTPTKGTKFYIQKSEKILSAATFLATTNSDKNAYSFEETSPNTFQDIPNLTFFKLEGVGQGFDGYIPCYRNPKLTGVFTPVDEVLEEWKGLATPEITTTTISQVEFYDNFCSIKSISKDSDSLSTEDVTTMCSVSSEFEPGEIEVGSIKLGFYYAPDEEIQKGLRTLFKNKETFCYIMDFSNERGTVFGRGFIEQSPNLDGQVKGKFESSVSIKQSRLDYYQPVVKAEG